MQKLTGMEESGLYAYLDLLVVSIAADIVPIREKIEFWLITGWTGSIIPQDQGLKALILQAKVEKEIQITDIVFKIGPRINASGRLEHAQASVELLIAPNLDEAIERAKLVDEVNSTRRNFDENITKEAFEMLAHPGGIR
jgi:single-stranded-DNA-specific exonuclease